MLRSPMGSYGFRCFGIPKVSPDAEGGTAAARPWPPRSHWGRKWRDGGRAAAAASLLYARSAGQENREFFSGWVDRDFFSFGFWRSVCLYLVFCFAGVVGANFLVMHFSDSAVGVL